MAWKKVNLKRWADEAGVDINEIDQKLKLRAIIIRVRTKRKLTQSDVAEIVGVSRSRIAQIEAGVQLQKTRFDIFLRILQELGYRYTINAKLAA